MEGEWQPIETAPKGEVVLVYSSHGVDIAHFGLLYEGWLDENYEDIDPTHWMPLPPPPKGIE